MAFNTLTVGANTYNSIGPGLYRLSTVTFGQPANDFKLVGGKRANKNAPTTAAITRIIEKDITVGSLIERRKFAASLNLSVPDGFTDSEIDTGILSISDFATLVTITRLLMGES